MQPQHRSARLLLLAGLAASACTEQTLPTAIPGRVPDAVMAAAGANNQKVKVKTLQLSANTLRINGPSVSGNVSIGNSGLAIPSGVVVRAEISQGAVSKEAVNTPTQCSPAPVETGKLPNGTCDMTFTASASNSAPGSSGTLSPGSATFTLRLVQTSRAGDTELATKTLLVNLVAAPSMTVTIAPTAVLIDGPASTATAVIQNPANSLQGMLIQGWIVQGVAPNQTRRPTGGSLVTCGSNAGVLPPGTCTMTIPVTASNLGEGIGLFASGAATFELNLIQSGSGNTTLDVKTAPVTLVWFSPHITRVVLESATLQIGGASVGVTADIQNGGPPRSGIVLGAQIHQFTNGHVVKGAGGLGVMCGGQSGDLPTTGTGVCTLQFPINALDDSNGGALVPGDAVLFLDLLHDGGNFHRERVNITLLAPKPVRISGITISPTLNFGTGNSYTAFLQNTGPSLSSVGLQATLSQGTATRAAGGRQVQCNSGPPGELPTGACSVPAFVVPFNAPNAGIGTLIPGPATLEIELLQGSTSLDKKIIQVTLVMSGPGIIGIQLSASSVLIGEQIDYTATFYNTTSAAITSVGFQGLLTQESIVDFGTGGGPVRCAGVAIGTLPPGVCTTTFTLNTRNLFETPAWNPGPATFRLELNAGVTLLDSKSLTLFLNILQ